MFRFLSMIFFAITISFTALFAEIAPFNFSLDQERTLAEYQEGLLLIDEKNCYIFDYLVQDYEEEFAPITKKQKHEDGKYALDSDWKFPYTGFYWIENSKVLGFCIKSKIDEYSDIAEFYVIPEFRRKKIGQKMAFALFDLFPGLWQIRQIEEANAAKEFWRNIIKGYTKGEYIELAIDDPIWGKVTCQRFKSQK